MAASPATIERAQFDTSDYHFFLEGSAMLKSYRAETPVRRSHNLRQNVRVRRDWALLAAAVAGLSSMPAMAADQTWVGNTSNLWSIPANWSTATPVNGDNLLFGVAG